MRKLCELFMMYWLHAWRQERRLRMCSPPGHSGSAKFDLKSLGPFREETPLRGLQIFASEFSGSKD